MRGSFDDLTGKQFGKLTVKKRHAVNAARNRVQWNCCCECGNEKVIRGDSLRYGITTSCGCQNPYTFKHGLSFSPEYKIWDSMCQRCHNPNNQKYKDYGARGIEVCEEWLESFEVFYRDMGPRPSEDHSIDRRDNDKGYCKENCRWATKEEQTNNTRTNINIAYQGKTQTLMQWSQELGFDYHNVKYRIRNGMLFEVAIQIDKIAKNSQLTLNGEDKPIKTWCKENGVSFAVFRYRLNKGWTFEEALTPIEKKLITLDGHSEFLEDWCELLGLDDKDSIYLKILRGDTIDSIIDEINGYFH